MDDDDIETKIEAWNKLIELAPSTLKAKLALLGEAAQSVARARIAQNEFPKPSASAISSWV
jgi:hypothetical protein